MNNLMQKILIDSAIEYSKNLLFTNENPDVCINDIHEQISNMFREFKKEDIAKLDPEPLISEDFSYVFGQLTRTYKKGYKRR